MTRTTKAASRAAGALLLAASAGASAMPVTFNFPSIMNNGGDGQYFDDQTELTKGTERGVTTAVFVKDGISVTFTASGTTGTDYVYLDARPFSGSPGGNRAPGSGIGVCQATSCTDEDEIKALDSGFETLTATFDTLVSISGLLFAQENNRPLISEADAARLVEIDTGSGWQDYTAGGSYLGSTFSFRVQGDLTDDLGLNAGNEFYLHEFTVAVVPEPATVALLGLGALILASAARRARG